MGKFLETTQHLQLFALLLILQALGLALGFVAVFLLAQVQFVQLALRPFTAWLRLGLALTLAAVDLELVGQQPQQGLVGTLFRGQGRHQFFDFLGGLGEVGDRLLHMVGGILKKVLGLFAFDLLKQFRRLLKRLILGLDEYGRILRQATGLAMEFPGGVDNLLLQLYQFLHLLAEPLLLFLLFLGTLAPLTLSKDFLKGSHLGEEHVAEGATGLTVGARVLGPKEPADQLAGFHFHILEGEQMRGKRLELTVGDLAQFEFLHGAASEVVGQTMTEQTEVILNLRGESDFFQGRHLPVTARTDDANFRSLVGVDHDLYPRRNLVGSTGGIDKFQFPLTRLGEYQWGQFGKRLLGMDIKLDALVVFSHQTSRRHRLIEMEPVGEAGALHDAQASGILDRPCWYSRIRRIGQRGVCPLELGILEHVDREHLRPPAIVLDLIGKWPIHAREGGSVDGILEVLDQRQAANLAIPGSDHKGSLAGETLAKMGQHRQRATALDIGITRIHLVEPGELIANRLCLFLCLICRHT